ncbi:hypothetical protein YASMINEVIRUS_1599 [Yasminevirus sp. GU-2018]|uniref:Ankyrin repeat protein n=1 Tax=Yasminevirus sp. GU-2018 TaxID=2420051 RepID=A0A5K0UAN2_9VIRU|nr:hypothetical protein YASMINEVIRUS_1599 [Yasminevirus sp. GU-2018]
MDNAYKNLFDGVLDGSINIEKLLELESELAKSSNNVESSESRSEASQLLISSRFKDLGPEINYSYVDEDGNNLIFYAITSAVKHNTTEVVDHIIDFHKGSINCVNKKGETVLYHLINEIKKNNCVLTDVEFYMFRELVDHVDKDILLNNTLKLCEFIIEIFDMSNTVLADVIITNFITPLAYKCQTYTYCHYKLNKITYKLHSHSYPIQNFLSSYLSYVKFIKVVDQGLVIRERISKGVVKDPVFLHRLNYKNKNNMLIASVRDVDGIKALTFRVGTLRGNSIKVSKEVDEKTHAVDIEHIQDHHLIKQNGTLSSVIKNQKLFSVSYNDNKIIVDPVSKETLTERSDLVDEQIDRKVDLKSVSIEGVTLIPPVNLKPYAHQGVVYDKLSLCTIENPVLSDGIEQIEYSIASYFVRVIQFEKERIFLASDAFYPIIKKKNGTHTPLTLPLSLVLSDKRIVVSYKEGDVVTFDKKKVLMLTRHRLDKTNVKDLKCTPIVHVPTKPKAVEKM